MLEVNGEYGLLIHRVPLGKAAGRSAAHGVGTVDDRAVAVGVVVGVAVGIARARVATVVIART